MRYFEELNDDGFKDRSPRIADGDERPVHPICFGMHLRVRVRAISVIGLSCRVSDNNSQPMYVYSILAHQLPNDSKLTIVTHKSAKCYSRSSIINKMA